MKHTHETELLQRTIYSGIYSAIYPMNHANLNRQSRYVTRNSN